MLELIIAIILIVIFWPLIKAYALLILVLLAIYYLIKRSRGRTNL